MTRLRVIDIETTGGPGSEIVEIGFIDVQMDGADLHIGRAVSQLFRPERGVPPEVMAVHHLTEEDLAPYAVCSREELTRRVWTDPTPNVFVAHNCEFERAFIDRGVTGESPWICTMKAALHVWPDAPKHSNQVLRYWRGHRHDPSLAMPPHRAAPDAYVTAHILADLLKEASVEDLVRWTSEPRRILKLPFGKHRGLAWADAPLDYLEWMSRQEDMDPDVVFYARRELDRRRAG